MPKTGNTIHEFARDYHNVQHRVEIEQNVTELTKVSEKGFVSTAVRHDLAGWEKS